MVILFKSLSVSTSTLICHDLITRCSETEDITSSYLLVVSSNTKILLSCKKAPASEKSWDCPAESISDFVSRGNPPSNSKMIFKAESFQEPQ